VRRFEKRQGNGAFSSKLERKETHSFPLAFGSDLGGLRHQKDTVLPKRLRELSTIG